MNKLLYIQPGIVNVIYHHAINSIVMVWEHLGPHAYIRLCAEAQLDWMRQKGVPVIIMDMSDAEGAPAWDDLCWFDWYLFPNFKEAGLHTLIIITARHPLARLCASSWERIAKRSGFDVFETGKFETACELAQAYQAGRTH